MGWLCLLIPQSRSRHGLHSSSAKVASRRRPYVFASLPAVYTRSAVDQLFTIGQVGNNSAAWLADPAAVISIRIITSAKVVRYRRCEMPHCALCAE